MNFRYLFLIIVFLAGFLGMKGQKEIPAGRFSPPLKIDLGVTGAFGEIRSGHFHSGVDFQVQQREGLPVYAIGDGWVSRIKVSPVGFGNALYIDHPGGFTSVYGHLKAYNDSVRTYSRQAQYEKESFEVDLFPANSGDTLRVKKGQLIGYAGNSGTSFGAHLHFEIRNTATERVINPLLFGFDYKDSFAPMISRLVVYPEGPASYINSCSEAFRTVPVLKSDRYYHLRSGDTIQAYGQFSFGVEAFDYFYNASDRNGWYRIKVFADKASLFSMQLDSFAFSETRYVNASIDFADNYENGSRIIRTRELPGNELAMHSSDENRGILDVTDGKVHELLVQVSDLAGNTRNLRFWLDGREKGKMVLVPSGNDDDSAVLISYNKAFTLEKPGIRIRFPRGAVYDHTWFVYKRLPGRKGLLSDRHVLSRQDIPVNNRIDVSIETGPLPLQLQSKVMIVRIGTDGRMHSTGGRYQDGWVSAEISQFGTYAIAADTVPPSIQVVRNKSKLKKSISFRVADNLSGITSYRGEVNGKWVLVEWDPKNKSMIYNYDEALKPGRNTLILTVEDAKGNRAKVSADILK